MHISLCISIRSANKKVSVYFAAKMPATAWLELLCRQSEAWQKWSKNRW